MTDIRKEVFALAKERLRQDKRVLLELATGFGKSKLALDLCEDYGAKNVVVLVPTDAVAEAWVAEVKKWNSPMSVRPVNYKSAHKVLDDFRSFLPPDIVVMDECHHITPLNLESISNYPCPLIGLSATVDHEKLNLLNELGFEREITVSLDRASEQDLIAPYIMNIILFKPDSMTRNMLAGNKEKKWWQTEVDALNYMEKRIGNAKRTRNSKSIEFAYIARTRLIRTLPSRMRVASTLIAKLRAKYPEAKMLVFAPDIEKCEELVPDCYYHSKSDDSGFTAFKEGKKHTLGSVNALSEGVNVHADMAIIVAGFSKERHTVQRLGRLLRKTADGKLGRAFLLVAEGTQDEAWAQNATEGLTNLKRYNASEIGL